jgi:hypothetical protein
MNAEGKATHGFEHGSSYFAEPTDGRERFSCRGRRERLEEMQNDCRNNPCHVVVTPISRNCSVTI